MYTQQGEKADRKMLIYTKMWPLAAVGAQQAKAHLTCVCCKSHPVSVFMSELLHYVYERKHIALNVKTVHPLSVTIIFLSSNLMGECRGTLGRLL